MRLRLGSGPGVHYDGQVEKMEKSPSKKAYKPYIKARWFLLLFLLLVFLAAGERGYRVTETQKEARKLVALLEDYKHIHGAYPKHLDELGIPIKNVFIYNTYSPITQGGNAYFLSGVVPPLKISYSSELKQWKLWVSRREFWRKEEFGIDPSFNQAYDHYRRGIDLRERGLLDEAIREHQMAVRLKPEYVDGRPGLGLVLKDKGLLDDAIREYQEVIRLQPDNVEARLNLFLILYEQERFDQALEAYQAYLKVSPPQNEEEIKSSQERMRCIEDLIQGKECDH